MVLCFGSGDRPSFAHVSSQSKCHRMKLSNSWGLAAAAWEVVCDVRKLDQQTGTADQCWYVATAHLSSGLRAPRQKNWQEGEAHGSHTCTSSQL